TGAGQLEGTAPADAAGRAGDQGLLAQQLHRDSSPAVHRMRMLFTLSYPLQKTRSGGGGQFSGVTGLLLGRVFLVECGDPRRFGFFFGAPTALEKEEKRRRSPHSTRKRPLCQTLSD